VLEVNKLAFNKLCKKKTPVILSWGFTLRAIMDFSFNLFEVDVVSIKYFLRENKGDVNKVSADWSEVQTDQ